MSPGPDWFFSGRSRNEKKVAPSKGGCDHAPDVDWLVSSIKKRKKKREKKGSSGDRSVSQQKQTISSKTIGSITLPDYSEVMAKKKDLRNSDYRTRQQAACDGEHAQNMAEILELTQPG